jgi:tetratricopeptide (TPR) repeat protein
LLPGRLIPFALILLLTAAAYAGALRGALVWDDRIHVAGNARVTEARWGELLGRPVGDYYRPAVFASFALDQALHGGRAAGFHATNIALHVIAAWLLLAALRALGAAGGSGAGAAWAALIFAIHPAQTEAVTYVSGRTDILAAVFSFATLLLYARARAWTGGAPRPAAALGALACFALALGAKESAILLPLALLAGDRLFGKFGAASSIEVGSRARGARDLRALLPYLILAAAYAAWRAHLGAGLVTLGAPEEIPARIAAALSAIAAYARIALFPVNLHLERFVPASAPGAAAGAALLFAGAAAFRRGSPAARFWLLWAAVAYAPVSNLVPVYPGLPAGTVFAPEHFLYLPLAGLLAAASLSKPARRAPGRRGPIGFALAATLLCFVLLVSDRNRDWRDEETIYRHTLRHSPGSARVRLNLGNLLLARNDVIGASEQFTEGLRRAPDDADLWINLGLARLRMGRPDDAARAMTHAAGLLPGDAQVWANLGAIHGTAGRLPEARRAYARALAIDPRNADARKGMAILDSLPEPGR